MTGTMGDQVRRATIARPLGGTEKIYWLLDQLYCLNFVVYAELTGDLEPAKLQQALDRVQDEIPLLRSQIVIDGDVPVFAPVAPDEYPLTVQDRPLQGWRHQLRRELDVPFPVGVAPLARVLCFSGKGSKSVVAMVFHHPIADGRSGVSVLVDVLRLATGGDRPPDYRKAHPSAQQLDVIRRQPRVQGVLKEFRFWLDKGREVLRFARQIPGFSAEPTRHRTSGWIPLRLSRQRSASLQAACRSHGTSVHGALGAAQILALSDEFTEHPPRVMALNSLADLRGVLTEELTERDLGLYVSTLTTVHRLSDPPDFWGLAREIRDQLQGVIESGDADLIHSFYPHARWFTPDLAGARMTQNIVALAPPSSMLTNIGRVASLDLHGQVAADRVGFLLSPPAQNPICVTATGYDGQLILNLLFDTDKMTPERAERISRGLVGYLERCSTDAG